MSVDNEFLVVFRYTFSRFHEFQYVIRCIQAVKQPIRDSVIPVHRNGNQSGMYFLPAFNGKKDRSGFCTVMIQAYSKDYNECIAQAQADQKWDARPELNAYPDNIDDYDTIYLGYLICWSKESMIIRTFLESYNLKGKKIVPFCTSGGSGISGSMKGVKAAAKGAKVVKGKGLTDMSSKSVAKWVKKKIK